MLVEALSRLRDRSDWQCWIAGAPQRPDEHRYATELRALASARGVDSRIQWLGERDDVSALLCAADVYCQPNAAAEAFGIAYVEALFTGLPVVATRLGAAMEILDATCALVVDPDSESVASALRALLDSPELRERLRSGGPTRARDLCDSSRVLRGLEARLAELCRRPDR